MRMKPNDFLLFVQISSMWSLQDIPELMDTRRYLTPETQFNGKPLIVYFAQTVLLSSEICTMEHFVDLMSSARKSPIIQVEQGPPAIGLHNLKNELYGGPSNRQKTT